MDKNDMIFRRDSKNNITCGGYKLDNVFKKLNIPPIQGSVFPQKGGGAAQTLAVPMGLFIIQQGFPSLDYKSGKQDNITDDLYSKLMNLTSNKSNKKFNYSRKRRKKSKRQTRKRI